MRNCRNRVATMLLPVLLLVALLPRGYMPDFAALRQGELVLTICRGTLVLPDAREGSAGRINDHEVGCPFGQLPVASVLVEPIVLPRPSLWDIVAEIGSEDDLQSRMAGPGGLGARGPPSV